MLNIFFNFFFWISRRFENWREIYKIDISSYCSLYLLIYFSQSMNYLKILEHLIVYQFFSTLTLAHIWLFWLLLLLTSNLVLDLFFDILSESKLWSQSVMSKSKSQPIKALDMLSIDYYQFIVTQERGKE